MLGACLMSPLCNPKADRQVDVHNLRLDNAPRVALEVARSDSIALMGLTVASAHGAGILVDSCKHVYVGSSDVAAAGDAFLVQASAGAAGLWPGQLDSPAVPCPATQGTGWRSAASFAKHALPCPKVGRQGLATSQGIDEEDGAAEGQPTSFLYVDGMRLHSRAAAVAVGGRMNADITSLVFRIWPLSPAAGASSCFYIM